MQELKEAGLSAKYAKSVGIAVDHRRTNLSVRFFLMNYSFEAWFYRSVVYVGDKGKGWSAN